MISGAGYNRREKMKIGKNRSITAVLVAALLTLSAVSCGKVEKVGQIESGDASVSPSGQTANTESTTLPPETEPPTEPVPEDKTVHVCAAGDNLIHYSVYKNAERYAQMAGEGAAYDFAPLYENVRYIIEDADVAILNQETIISQSNEIRGANGGALLFNSPPEVADAVIDLGFADKIVVCDTYSKSNADDSFDILRERIDSRDTFANGSIFSSGRDALITDLIYMADQGKFDIKTDPVLITGSKSYVNPTVDELSKYGFVNILVWEDISSYDELIEYVRTISLIVSGVVTDSVQKMSDMPDEIADVLDSSGIQRHDAFYVTYSGSVMKVGNENSLANSMILAAGGVSLTEDPSKENPTYEASIPDLVEGKNVVVFVDSSIWKSEDYLNQLNNQLGPYADEIVKLDPLWNNFTIRSTEGVWVMACAMYPELFTGDVPSSSEVDDDGMFPYLIASGLSIVVILALSYYLMRK